MKFGGMVVLDDGRTVSVPLVWFPRLPAAAPQQRTDWEPIGGGIAIHWEAIDEDISVASLLQPGRFVRLAEGALRWTVTPPGSNPKDQEATRPSSPLNGVAFARRRSHVFPPVNSRFDVSGGHPQCRRRGRLSIISAHEDGSRRWNASRE